MLRTVHHLVIPGRTVRHIDSTEALAAYTEHAELLDIAGNLRQLLGYDPCPRSLPKGKCEGHQLLDSVSWLIPQAGAGEILPLLGTTKQKWESYKGDCSRLWPGHELPATMPAMFEKLVCGKKAWDGWRLASKEEAASLAADAIALGDGASLVGLVYNPTPSQPLPNYSQSLPHAPMMWAQDEVLDATFSGMAIGGEIALDGDDFDSPIYRSLGSLTAFAEGGDALDGDDFDEPVYRSMSAAPLDASGDRQDMREGDEQLWLQTMPPLLCRQRGGQLA